MIFILIWRDTENQQLARQDLGAGKQRIPNLPNYKEAVKIRSILVRNLHCQMLVSRVPGRMLSPPVSDAKPLSYGTKQNVNESLSDFFFYRELFLRSLWLPFKALHDFIASYITVRTLRSSSHNLFAVPRFDLKTYGGRSFTVAAPTIWNSLPLELLQTCVSVSTFKSNPKTWLFKEAFS